MGYKGSDKCLNKAKEDEMLFVLMARDETAPITILEWIKLNLHKQPEDKLREAFDCAMTMIRDRWQPTEGRKYISTIKAVNVGDVFECTKDVVCKNHGILKYFKKGKVYYSHIQSCITDETGDRLHSIGEGDWINEHFKKLVELDIVPLMAGDRLMCVKDVKDDNGQVEFLNSEEYLCTHDGCLTAEGGKQGRRIDDIISYFRKKL